MAVANRRQIVPTEVDLMNQSESDDLESIESDLTSLSSSIYNYVYENGRTYHAYRSGAYVLPNDEREQERLDLLHHVFRLSLDGELCRTKLTSPQRVLDIGTGTGIWAIEIADEFPSSQVTGVDLSPIQPGWYTYHHVQLVQKQAEIDRIPPNVQFVIDDVNLEWNYPKDSFDFIHVRCLAGSLTTWPQFLKQCYDHLKPGGRIELSECRTHMECDDGSYPEDCHTRKWIAEFNHISHSHGMIFDLFPEFENLLRDALFNDIDIHQEICPIGTWPKDRRLKQIGRYFRLQFLDSAIDSYSLALFTRLGGWTPAEVEVLLAYVRNEIKSNQMHVYTHCSFATAQKPRK